jgi:hypothetical protein
MTEKTLDDLLDLQLDDLKDLPEFGVFPDGAHVATIKFARKEVNKKDCIELTLVGEETQELADPEHDKPITPKAEMSVLYDLGNEFGQGNLKKIATILSAHFGTKGLGETLQAAEGAACLVTTKKRGSKDASTGETKYYGGITTLAVL